MIKLIFSVTSFFFFIVLNIFSPSDLDQENNGTVIHTDHLEILSTEIKTLVSDQTAFYGIPEYVYYAYLLQDAALKTQKTAINYQESSVYIHQVQNAPLAEFSDALFSKIGHLRSEPENMRDWAILVASYLNDDSSYEDILDIMLKTESLL